MALALPSALPIILTAWGLTPCTAALAADAEATVFPSPALLASWGLGVPALLALVAALLLRTLLLRASPHAIAASKEKARAQQQQGSKAAPQPPSITDKGRGASRKGKGAARSFTVEEVAQHCTRGDCWIIIKDRVYNVTEYVDMHPGGDAILNDAGGDATKGFFGPQHPGAAFDTVEEYFIGFLER